MGTTAYRSDEGEWVVQAYWNVGAFAILGSPIPEPCTLLLLGIGAAIAIRKHR